MDSESKAVYGADEIERLYSELDDMRCECDLDGCAFHEKIIQIAELQERQIAALESSAQRLASSISRALPLLEMLDAGLLDVK